jgi:hypothetical protein
MAQAQAAGLHLCLFHNQGLLEHGQCIRVATSSLDQLDQSLESARDIEGLIESVPAQIDSNRPL